MFGATSAAFFCAAPENAADYLFLQEQCNLLEELKQQHEAAREEWLMLEEME